MHLVAIERLLPSAPPRKQAFPSISSCHFIICFPQLPPFSPLNTAQQNFLREQRPDERPRRQVGRASVRGGGGAAIILTLCSAARGTSAPGPSRLASPPTPHLPLVGLRVVLELDQPVLLSVEHGAVVHGDDDWTSQQGPGGPAAHHGAQHRLAILHQRPGGARRETHTHTDRG